MPRVRQRITLADGRRLGYDFYKHAPDVLKTLVAQP
jgi:hypothetical protein